jgi:hypothetical protein
LADIDLQIFRTINQAALKPLPEKSGKGLFSDGSYVFCSILTSNAPAVHGKAHGIAR